MMKTKKTKFRGFFHHSYKIDGKKCAYSHGTCVEAAQEGNNNMISDLDFTLKTVMILSDCDSHQ